MRMWLVDPRTMCRRHLLGEHVELHMLVGALRRGKRLGRFISDGLVVPHLAERRHAELAAEMTARGYRHASPLVLGLTEITHHEYLSGHINVAVNERELARRCPACAARAGEKGS